MDASASAEVPGAVGPAHDVGWLRRVIGPLLTPLYRWEQGRRSRRFDLGKGVVTLDRPVISVGNLTTGGTGKTPLVMYVVHALRDAGRWPAVAMRGYAAPRGEGRRSDEAQEYLSAWRDLPLVAQPDRIEGLLELFATPEGERVDCVVLDDGFQHRQLARQLDIALIDATRPAPWQDRLLPAGSLREPVEALARAGVVVLSRAGMAGAARLASLRERLRTLAPAALVCACDHQWAGLIDQAGAGVGVDWLRGRRVLVACAIGNPGAFLAQARATGLVSAGDMVLRDHDPFAPGTLITLLRRLHESRAEALLVTQKDWSKLARVRPERWPCPVLRPRLALRWLDGEHALRTALLAATRSEPESARAARVDEP